MGGAMGPRRNLGEAPLEPELQERGPETGQLLLYLKTQAGSDLTCFAWWSPLPCRAFALPGPGRRE